jgi:hypothetical protein
LLFHSRARRKFDLNRTIKFESFRRRAAPQLALGRS